MDLRVDGPLEAQGIACAQILEALPDWFGVPSAVEKYVSNAESLPSFVAYVSGKAAGILTFKSHFEQAAEIDVIGVLPGYHRRGIGRALVSTLELHLRNRGVEYLQVKTLDESAESEAYERTRRFYGAMGFVPLEMWPTIWDPDYPCLQMVKFLGPVENGIPGRAT